jgi:hypothetical protein
MPEIRRNTMKYFVLPLVMAVLGGTLCVGAAEAAPPKRAPLACDNPYNGGYAMGCDTRDRAAAKKKNALIKHPVKKRHTIAQ